MKKTIHPFIFAIYPVLFLYSYNLIDVPINQIFRPILITALFTVLFWLCLHLIFKDTKKTGLIVSLFLLLFFSFKHFHRLLYFLGLKIENLIHFLIICTIIFILISYCLIRTRRNLQSITTILNVVGVTLLIITIINITATLIQVKAYSLGLNEIKKHKSDLTVTQKITTFPSIYYIILDSYGRQDIVKDLYEYDNSEFLNYLTQKGFRIAKKGRSNYCQSFLSLGSSLNLGYLDWIEKETAYRSPVGEVMRKNELIAFLKQYGYTFVAFSSGYEETEFWNADVYIQCQSVNEFELILIIMSPIPEILGPISTPYDALRHRFLYIIDHIPDMTKMKPPLFVFAHLQGPHPPFVFGQNGEKIPYNGTFYEYSARNDYKEGYKNQLIFVNKKVKEMVDKILAASPTPPIIIIQGDHGPNLKGLGNLTDIRNIDPKERTSILNAYYLPGDGSKEVYDTITPVNSFRIILNHYFHTSLPLLEDRSYISTEENPFELYDVTDVK